jgi:polyhydroxyalkanoate synthase subunit PhaC
MTDTSGKGSPPPSADLAGALAAQTAQSLEVLSKRLLEATGAAQRIALHASELQAEHPGRVPQRIDPYGLAPYAADLGARLAADPEKLVRAQQALFEGYAQIWTDAVKSMLGDTAGVAPPPKDKRFSDPDWGAMPLFDVMRRTYLHTSNWLESLVDGVDGLDEMTRRKSRFFVKQLSDAVSPSNFLLSNPVALRELLNTGGESLVKGLANLEHDVVRGHGHLAISQTDETPFRVGETIAASKGKVVYRGELFELLQYDPLTERVFESPMLIFPPWINKFYILDLRPENSMIRWLTEQGHTVMVVSWVNAGPDLSDRTFADYMRGGIIEAVDAALAATGAPNVNTVGYCIGGTLLASTMAAMAADPGKWGTSKINSATFFASQQDFVEAGDLKVFTDDAALDYIRDEIEASGGVLDASVMAETFNFLRANDLVWQFVINNYLLGKAPKAFDLLYWNSDQTRMPKALHLFYLERFYRDNALSAGVLEIDGTRLDLGKVPTPVYMQSSREDHIAPYRSIYRGARLFGGPVRMILAGSGHIAGVVNAPVARKYQHWLPAAPADGDQPPLPATVDLWQAGLTEHPGSWWTDWAVWLAARSGPQVPARQPGDMGLGDAPGSYVLVKS